MINVDNVVDIHAQMLAFRLERSAILASNIANVDTPSYKARDLSFHAVLSQVENQQVTQVKTGLQYRIPVQRSRDGNTVELDSEQVRFAQNAIEYQQSLQFLNSKFKGLKSAIEGK